MTEERSVDEIRARVETIRDFLAHNDDGEVEKWLADVTVLLAEIDCLRHQYNELREQHRVDALVMGQKLKEAEQREAALRRTLADAVLLLRRCLNSGMMKAINEGIRTKTLDWIRRNGLSGSPLRESESEQVESLKAREAELRLKIEYWQGDLEASLVKDPENYYYVKGDPEKTVGMVIRSMESALSADSTPTISKGETALRAAARDFLAACEDSWTFTDEHYISKCKAAAGRLREVLDPWDSHCDFCGTKFATEAACAAHQEHCEEAAFPADSAPLSEPEGGKEKV